MSRVINSTIITIFMLVYSSLVASDEYSIAVSSVPKPVTFNFPAGFKLAESNEASFRRKAFLNFYKQNPQLSGNYDDILLVDWSNKAKFPQIVVGSLGTLERFQGNISKSNWHEIRAEFEKATPQQISKIREEWRPRIEGGSPVAFSTYDELIWLNEQNDPNSFTILSHLRSEIDGEDYAIFSARKIIYHNGYIVFANISVDSSKSGALNEIREYLASTVVLSI